MDAHTDRLLGQLRHISSVRAVDLAARYTPYLDMEAIAFFNDDPGELRALVTNEGAVLRRTDRTTPPLWELYGIIESWTVELRFEPEDVPRYLGGGRLSRRELLEALAPAFDAWAAAGPFPDGHLDFIEAEEAIPYAHDLRAVAAEHGMDAAVVVAAEFGESEGRGGRRNPREQQLLDVQPVRAGGGDLI